MNNNRVFTMRFGKKPTSIVIGYFKKPRKHRKGLIGIVGSPLFSEKVPLMIDPGDPEDRDYDYACVSVSPGGEHPRITMDREIFYGFLRGDAMARFTLFHEIGHYANGDLRNPDFTSSSYDNMRREAIESGTVLEMELRADLFAEMLLGKAKSLEALAALASRCTGEDDALSAQELSMRMDATMGR